MENLEKIINIPLPPEILWILFAGVVVFFLVMAFILGHHWKYYGIKGNSKVFARALFWIIAVFLIVLMVSAILFFETT
ncbi:hypothetical protein GW764_00215 [Candidatus Parcubacteria bacterium]|nr:hypothetical protein [Candidatus Parcubacteria bacterium]